MPTPRPNQPDAPAGQPTDAANADHPVGDTVGNTAGARRWFVAATVVDALGSGLWMPFALLFLVHAQKFPLVDAGTALSLGALIGLATGPFTGALVDRFGPLTVLLASNLVRLAAFCCYPLVSAIWQVVLVTAVIGVGDRLFWTANAPFVNSLTTHREAEHVLGTQTIGRFAGAGIGAGATALLPVVTSPLAYHLLAYLNAASFGIAALLITGLRGGTPALPSPPPTHRTSWLTVLRQRGFVGFCSTHVIFTLSGASKYAMLPILVRDVLHGPQWIPGVAIGLGTITIVVGQRPITRWLTRWSRGTALMAAALLFAVSFAALAPLTMIPLGAGTVIILITSLSLATAEAMFAPTATAAAAAAAPPAAQGRASALFQLSWGLSSVLAPVLLTNLLTISNTLLWLTLAAIAALAVPALLKLRDALPAGSLR